MADEPNKAQPAAGEGEPKGEPNKAKTGEEKGKKSEVDLSNYVPKEEFDKLSKSLEEHKGTVGALTKKNEQLLAGLKSALGEEGDDKKSTPEELIAKLQDEVNSLKGKERTATMKEFVGEYLNKWKDKDGNLLTDEAKSYIKKRFSAYDKDPEDIQTILESDISDLSEFMTTISKVDKNKAESRPDAKAGQRSTAGKKTANEILESLNRK